MTLKLFAWFFTKASIRVKLVVSFTLLASIPALVLGLNSFSQTFSSIEAQTVSTVSSNCIQLALELDTRLQKETDYTRYLAYNLNFRGALEIATKDPIRLARQLNESVEPNFWYFVASDSYMKAIDIYSGNVVRNVGPFLKSDEHVRDTAWYRMHQNAFYTIFRFENERLYATRTVLDLASSSKAIGVMDVELFPKILTEPIDSTRFMDNGVLLADAAGNIIVGKPSSNPEADSLVEAFAAGKGLLQDMEKAMILQSATLKSTGWKLYYYVDRDAVYTQIAPILNSTILVVLAVIMVAVILTGLLSRGLSKRILKLRDLAFHVAEGKFDGVAFTADTDEIGVVTNSLATMSSRLQDMIQQVYELELEKKGSELKVLQASINPHFLYNCLSGIKWKALYSSEDSIARIAGLMATFYRTSLNNGSQITSVRNELENVRSYIDIQKEMHEDSFDAFIEADESTLNEPMLNFMLQPLAENAIKHGIDQIVGEGERGSVIVRCKEEDGYLVFQVLNNGLPLDTMRAKESLNTPGNGYGLYNIRQRIQLYYDKGSSLEADTANDGYTRFTLRLRKLLPK